MPITDCKQKGPKIPYFPDLVLHSCSFLMKAYYVALFYNYCAPSCPRLHYIRDIRWHVLLFILQKFIVFNSLTLKFLARNIIVMSVFQRTNMRCKLHLN